MTTTAFRRTAFPVFASHFAAPPAGCPAYDAFDASLLELRPRHSRQWNAALSLYGLAVELAERPPLQQHRRLAVAALRKALDFAVQHDRELLLQGQLSTIALRREVGGFGSMSALVAAIHLRLAEAHHRGYGAHGRDDHQALLHLRAVEREWSRLAVASHLSAQERRCAVYQVFCLSRLAMLWACYSAVQPLALSAAAAAAVEKLASDDKPSDSTSTEEKQADAQVVESKEENEDQGDGGELETEKKKTRRRRRAKVPHVCNDPLVVDLAKSGFRAAAELSGGSNRAVPLTMRTAYSYDLLGAAYRQVGRTKELRGLAKNAHCQAIDAYRCIHEHGVHCRIGMSGMQLAAAHWAGHYWAIDKVRRQYSDALALLTHYYAALEIEPPPAKTGHYRLPTEQQPYLYSRLGVAWSDPSALLVADALHGIAQCHELDRSHKSAAKFYYRELAVLYRCLNSEHPRIARIRQLAEQHWQLAATNPYSFPRRSKNWLAQKGVTATRCVDNNTTLDDDKTTLDHDKTNN